MTDLNRIIDGLGRSGLVSGFLGGAAGGALTSALLGKKGRKTAKNLLAVGGAAAVGSLAWKAYKSYQANNRQQAPVVAAPAPAPSRAIPASPESGAWAGLEEQHFQAVCAEAKDEGTRARLLVTAMVAAIFADGRMDPSEHERLFAATERLDLGREERLLLLDMLKNPPSLEQIVAQAPDPETAIEIYTASLMVVDPQRAEAQQHLRNLAFGLNLPPALVSSLHEQLAEQGSRGVHETA